MYVRAVGWAAGQEQRVWTTATCLFRLPCRESCGLAQVLTAKFRDSMNPKVALPEVGVFQQLSFFPDELVFAWTYLKKKNKNQQLLSNCCRNLKQKKAHLVVMIIFFGFVEMSRTCLICTDVLVQSVWGQGDWFSVLASIISTVIKCFSKFTASFRVIGYRLVPCQP